MFRTIPWEIKGFEALGLPQVVKVLCDKPRGLVFVTGPTGSGKSTTLAAMLDKINSERDEHMITIEDPIEFLHNHKKCLVNQREIHSDTHSFANSLRAALREDPDVVLIGEMRDLETIESALRIAETGHLTFATLHTNSAVSTINRIVDVFPAHQQPQVRAQLSMVLEGILCQSLLPRVDGRGRVMVMEILVPTAAIRNLIREDKIHQIYSAMQTGTGASGMQTFQPEPGEHVFPEAHHAGSGIDAVVESGRVAGLNQPGRDVAESGRNSHTGPALIARQGIKEEGNASLYVSGYQPLRGSSFRRAHGGE